jgi:Ser/Thr protein kinase RdoA (MazF antagonist)
VTGPEDILAAGWPDLLALGRDDSAGGLINRTWMLGAPPAWVLQRVNPIFRPEVHQDIEAVTAHLAGKGMATPRLRRTVVGALCHVAEDGAAWRVMDFVPGRSPARVDGPALAAEAGALVARFHRATDDLRHEYRMVRPGAHDTAAHMAALARAMELPVDGLAADAGRLGGEILSAWSSRSPTPELPPRHAHGDLKISNLRFDAAGRGLCLLDLDTLAWLPLDVELGDAWRSWCNPVGEDSADTFFDVDIFAGAVAGYRAERDLAGAEIEGLVGAAERIALELASRFCRDVFEDRYFGWDFRRYPSRAAHNLFRATGQLRLAQSARRQERRIRSVLSERR